MRQLATHLTTAMTIISDDLDFFRHHADELFPFSLSDLIMTGDHVEWQEAAKRLHDRADSMDKWEIVPGQKQPPDHREFLIDVSGEWERLSGRPVPEPPAAGAGGAFVNFALAFYRASGRVRDEDDLQNAEQAIVTFSRWWRKGDRATLPRRWVLSIAR